MAVTEIERWLARIQASEAPLLTPAVKAGADFLISARNEENSWGQYKSLSLDLYSSSLALEALRSCAQEEIEAAIRSSTIGLKTEVVKRLESFKVQELIAAVRLLAGVRVRTDDVCSLTDRVIERLESKRNGFGWGEPTASIPVTAEALAVLSGNVSVDKLTPWMESLSEEQNADGGWPVSPGGESSLLPSARAAVALAGSQVESKNRALREYLRANVSSLWDSGTTAEPYTIAVVLDACARVGAVSYETILRGIDALLTCRNEDGAWGERQGGVSNVEVTSIAVKALCSAGQNRLVPAQLATAAVDTTGKRVAELEKQLEQMQQDIKSRAGREVKAILKENDSLNQQVLALENDRRVLTRQLEELQYQREYMAAVQERRVMQSSPTPYATIRSIGVSLALVCLSSGLIFLLGKLVPSLREFLPPATSFAVVVGLITAVSGIYLAALTFYVRRGARDIPTRKELEMPDYDVVFRRLREISYKWPASVRETFVHELRRIGFTESLDQREAISRSIAMHFSFNPNDLEDLRRVVSLFLNLSASEQEMVMMRLRGPDRVAASS